MDRVLIERAITFTPTGEQPRQLVARIGYPEIDPDTDIYRRRMGYDEDDPRGVRWRAPMDLTGGPHYGMVPYAYGPDAAKAIVQAIYLLHVQAHRLSLNGTAELMVGTTVWRISDDGLADGAALDEANDRLQGWAEAFDAGERCISVIIAELDAGVTLAGDLKMDVAMAVPTMDALINAMVDARCEVEAGLAWGDPAITDDAIIQMRELRAMLTDWITGCEFSPHARDLARRSVAILRSNPAGRER